MRSADSDATTDGAAVWTYEPEAKVWLPTERLFEPPLISELGMTLIKPSDYYDISKVTTGQLDTDPQLSPDESRVAFPIKEPASDTGYETTIYVAKLSGGEPKRFTSPGDEDVMPRWSPSGDRLAFLSDRGSTHPQLWVMPTDGGEARPVTNTIGGVTDYCWAPDGETIAFTQSVTATERRKSVDIDQSKDTEYEREDPDPRVINRTVYRVHDGFINGKRSHVYTIDLPTDTVTRITHDEYDFLGPEWGDARTLYYTSAQGENSDDSYEQTLFRYEFDTGREQSITEFTFPASFPASPDLAASSDGRVAYPFRPPERATMQQTDIHILDVNTGEEVVVTADFDRMVRRLAQPPKWGPEEEYLYFTTPSPGRIPIWRVATGGEQAPEPVLHEAAHHVTGFDIGRERLVFAQSEWDHPGDIFVATPAGNDIRRISRVNKEYLQSRTVSEPEEIYFEAPDGTSIQGYVLTPPNFSTEATYPLVVEIHGGPHYLWTTAGTMWHEFQALAAAGYVVFWCNPRGSVGWGEDFMQAIYRDWGGVDYEDIMAGVETVAERNYVDADNMFVIGGSYGGFMTSWIVGHSDRFKAAVSQRGVNDIPGMYGSTDGYKFLEDEFGAVPWEDHQLLWEHSPAAHVDNVSTPTLLMHAEEDYRSPINTSEMFYRGLKKNDVETYFIRYPREGHELSRTGEPQHVIDRLERILEWINGYSDHHEANPVPETGFSMESID